MDPLARYDPLVDDYEGFRAACERPLPAVVRVNGIKADREGVCAALDETGVGWQADQWHPDLLRLDTASPGNTWPDVLGWIHGQEAVSAIPPVVLDPSPGDTVWDTCAAPGSKTAQLADLMGDRGLLIATDDSLGRLAPLRSNAERLGLTNLAVDRADARHFSLDRLGVDAVDAALVDAPCSGEGTVRKNPSALDDWSESFLDGIAGLQRGLLTRAVQATRPGGTVVYSTCTFAPEENEAVLDHVLSETDCRLVPFDVSLPSTPGVTAWRDDQYDPTVQRARRFWPHQTDAGGFFCAKLEVAG